MQYQLFFKGLGLKKGPVVPNRPYFILGMLLWAAQSLRLGINGVDLETTLHT
jgi:hypothetical protein